MCLALLEIPLRATYVAIFSENLDYNGVSTAYDFLILIMIFYAKVQASNFINVDDHYTVLLCVRA